MLPYPLLLSSSSSGIFILEKKKHSNNTTSINQIISNLLPIPFSWISAMHSCTANSPQAKQEVFFLLIGQIPAVCRSMLSPGRPCGNTTGQRGGGGRMQVDCSPLCQLLVLCYQPIRRELTVCMCRLQDYLLFCFYSKVSGRSWKINVVFIG